MRALFQNENISTKQQFHDNIVVVVEQTASLLTSSVDPIVLTSSIDPTVLRPIFPDFL